MLTTKMRQCSWSINYSLITTNIQRDKGWVDVPLVWFMALKWTETWERTVVVKPHSGSGLKLNTVYLSSASEVYNLIQPVWLKQPAWHRGWLLLSNQFFYMNMHLHTQQHKNKQQPLCSVIPVQQEPGENSHVSVYASLQHNTPVGAAHHDLCSCWLGHNSQTSDKHH